MPDPVGLIFAPEEHGRVLAYARSRLSGGPTLTHYEARGIRKDGEEISLKLAVSSIVLSGRRVLQGAVEDITERKRAEEMKDNLIRDVSHELKTPLAKMQMGVDLLMEMVGAPSIDRQKVARTSEIVTDNVQRLQDTVNSILDLSLLESGQTPYHKTKVQPENLIRQVIVDMRPLAEAKGLELVAELLESLPQVEGDREKLLRVLTNLVDNALKFTEWGKIVVLAEKKAHEVEIAVSDSGRGIPRENLERVFERFWQENPSIPGAGIGLAICKTIVEAHGGKIWAESAGRGQGTTVRFTLPKGE
jgi:signal transduction histidine kinase